MASRLRKEHSKKNTLEIVKYIGSNKKRFSEFWNLLLHGETIVKQRGGWVLYHHLDGHSGVSIPFQDEAIKHLSTEIHQAVQRPLLKMQLLCPMVEDPGLLVDKCFHFLNDPKITTAVKMFSMRIIYKVGKKEPDLLPELVLSLKSNLDHATPGFKNAALKILTKI